METVTETMTDTKVAEAVVGGEVAPAADATEVVPVEVVTVVEEYLLTVRLRIPAVDDVEARGKAVMALGGMCVVPGKDGMEVKLQAVSKGAPPRKVDL